MTSLTRKSLAVVVFCLLMSGPKVLAQVAEAVTAENFGDAVIYANSSAKVYGVVTINDQPAEAGDVVGFFVGTELRFKGTVIISGGTAYVTGLMNAEEAMKLSRLRFTMIVQSWFIRFPAYH